MPTLPSGQPASESKLVDLQMRAPFSLGVSGDIEKNIKKFLGRERKKTTEGDSIRWEDFALVSIIRTKWKNCIGYDVNDLCKLPQKEICLR